MKLYIRHVEGIRFRGLSDRMRSVRETDGSLPKPRFVHRAFPRFQGTKRSLLVSFVIGLRIRDLGFDNQCYRLTLLDMSFRVLVPRRAMVFGAEYLRSLLSSLFLTSFSNVLDAHSVATRIRNSTTSFPGTRTTVVFMVCLSLFYPRSRRRTLTSI